MYDPRQEAYKELMRFHKIDNKFLLQLKIAKLWLLHGIASIVPSPDIAAAIHRMRGVKIGKNVYLGNDIHLDLLHPDLITLEDYVTVGMRTMIFAHVSHWSPFLNTIYGKTTAPVRINKGAWIAPGCIILPGVTVGENSVVGAGSVVTKDVEPFTVVAGSPAKLIKKLNSSTSS